MDFFPILQPTNTHPLVDFACAFPIIQQGVGVCGALFSIANLVGNLAKRVFNEGIYAFQRNPSQEQVSQKQRFREANNQFRENHLDHLVLNICRCVPVYGSVVSIIRFSAAAVLNGTSTARSC